MKLPWFTPKPLAIGDVYPVGGGSRDCRTAQVTAEVTWDWPKWVKFEIAFFDRNGELGTFRDFTGDTGEGFVNVWGHWLIRTRWELFKYSIRTWAWEKREQLARRIYPWE